MHYLWWYCSYPPSHQLLSLLQPYTYFSYVTIFCLVSPFCSQAEYFPREISSRASRILSLSLFSGKQHSLPGSVRLSRESSPPCEPSWLTCFQRWCCADLLPVTIRMVTDPKFYGRWRAVTAADGVSVCSGGVAVPPLCLAETVNPCGSSWVTPMLSLHRGTTHVK